MESDEPAEQVKDKKPVKKKANNKGRSASKKLAPPAKTSVRLQKNVSIHSKDKDTDSLVVEIADKKDVDIGEILRDMKKLVYDPLQMEHPEDYFEKHFHVILTEEPGMIAHLSARVLCFFRNEEFSSFFNKVIPDRKTLAFEYYKSKSP